MPRLDAGQGLFDLFKKSGMFDQTINGVRPLAWSELRAFSEVYSLSPFETQLIRNMSVAFVNGINVGSDPLAVSPMESKNG